MTQKKVGVRQRTSYSLEEKLVVVKYAQENGRNVAAKHFNLNAPMFLYNWIIEQRKKGFAVNYISMRLQMCKILKEPVIQALYPAGERRTKISQKLPEDIEQKLDEFRRFVIRLRAQFNFDLNNIFNIDETSVWFDMAGNMMVNNKGDKTVHICTTGNDKNHFTVVLTCSADGTKYPPICIFKGKQLPRGEVIPKSVICRIRMSENLSKESAMIVYDSFRGHLEKSVKIKFKQHNFHLAVIPVGLTSVCQPLDVSINKPFKDNLQKEWHEWMSRGGSGVTAAGNLKRARISDVCG
ncbi:pogo transposable element with KRAB domain [Rhizophagus clarus]|uniref:Pogo transposable element with KRAB domain n=1 Tax=Rhizophagus clarus TaxID=94130 RepID=A0A8H3LRA4_9GLOM|nr:pogo transposable element with KRAB domain [Rhizophagus clarus]